MLFVYFGWICWDIFWANILKFMIGQLWFLVANHSMFGIWGTDHLTPAIMRQPLRDRWCRIFSHPPYQQVASFLEDRVEQPPEVALVPIRINFVVPTFIIGRLAHCHSPNVSLAICEDPHIERNPYYKLTLPTHFSYFLHHRRWLILFCFSFRGTI